MSTARWLRAVAVVVALASPASVLAHPGGGLVVDRQGRIFFVSTFENLVMTIDAKGKVRRFVTDPRLRTPHHLVLSSTGQLYVTSDFDGVVWRIGEDGSLSEYFNPARLPKGSEIHIGAWGDPFAIDAAGSIIAGATPEGRSLVRITTDGAVTPIRLPGSLSFFHMGEMTVGRDGTVYLTASSRIWRIEGDSGVAIVPKGDALVQGGGAAVDSVGNIYVADYFAQRVLRLGPDGTANTPPVLAKRTFTGPRGVAVGPDGRVYVLSTLASGFEVWRVDADRVRRIYRHGERAAMLVGALMVMVPLLLIVGQWKHRSPTVLDWIARSVLIGLVLAGLYVFAKGLPFFSWARHPLVFLYLVAAWQSRPTALLRKADALG